MNNLILSDVSLPEGAFNIYSFDRAGTLCHAKDRIVAVLLSCIPTFYDDILEIRKNLLIAIKPIHSDKLDKDILLDDVLMPDIFLYLYKDPELLNSVKEVLVKYKLSERWFGGIISLVSYDILVLPIRSVITLSLSDNPIYAFSQQAFKSKNNTDNELSSLRRLLNPSDSMAFKKNIPIEKQLTITINERMSITELSNWIKSNETLKNMLMKLEKTPYSGIRSDDVLTWGHHVCAYKEFVDYSSSIETIEHWLDSKLPGDVPDSRKLDVYYKRFMKARNKFIP